MNLISSFSDIRYIIVDVDEKILEKNLKKFAKTSLDLNGLTISDNDAIYANYLEFSNQYQIIVTDKKYNFLEYEIFSVNYMNKTSICVDLYIYEKYISIYKDGCLYYIQKVEYEVNEHDLKYYLEKNLNLKIDYIYKIDDANFKQLLIAFNKSTPKSNLHSPFHKSNILNIYLIYIFVIVLSLGFYISHTFLLDTNDINTTSTKPLIKPPKYMYLQEPLNKLYKKLDSNMLVLKSLNFKDNGLLISINSISKEKIYRFLNNYKNKIVSSQIKFNENKQIYECEVNVKNIR